MVDEPNIKTKFGARQLLWQFIMIQFWHLLAVLTVDYYIKLAVLVEVCQCDDVMWTSTGGEGVGKSGQ